MIHRRAARRDANEPAIVEALQRAGATVVRLALPVDLLVGYRGLWRLYEVKDGAKPKSRRKLTDGQQDFVSLCAARGLPVHVVETPEQALISLRCDAKTHGGAGCE